MKMLGKYDKNNIKWVSDSQEGKRKKNHQRSNQTKPTKQPKNIEWIIIWSQDIKQKWKTRLASGKITIPGTYVIGNQWLHMEDQ